jgi:endonuclease III
MIKKIENIVCVGEGYTPEEIHIRSREDGIKETRQIIMFFAKDNTTLTWDQIAKHFCLDHATAISAYKRISGLIETDNMFRDKMQKYSNRIKAIKIDKMVEYSDERLATIIVEIGIFENKIQELKNLVAEINKELQLISRRSNNLKNN